MRPLFVLVAFALPASAQPEPGLPITRLTLSAAAAPVPALRYELLPGYRDQIQGNAALSYHRAMLLKGEHREIDPEAAALRDLRLDEMAAKPAKEVNVEELRKYLSAFRLVFRELENGARRDRCDWDLEKRIDSEGIGVILPEVQKTRELARLLSLRCRMHIVEEKLDEALRDVQIGLALARHVADGPTLIQSLVGMAIFNIFAQRLEQISELPKAPNLYWSLTALPRPMFDLRRALEGEMRTLEGTMPMLRDLDKRPLSIEQAQKMLDQWIHSMREIAGHAEWIPSRFALAGLVALHHPNARKALLAMGKSEAEVNAMPAAQVVLLDSLTKFKGMRDEMFIWFSVPYPEARQGLAKANDKVRRMRSEAMGDVFLGALMMLLPAVDKVHFASARTERRIAQMRTVEALRLHAAETGRFPDKLADITVVPVPVDPVMGKPFEYERTSDGKAVLYGPPPKDEAAHAGNTFKFELTLQK
jgi:hypothetical protein